MKPGPPWLKGDGFAPSVTFLVRPDGTPAANLREMDSLFLGFLAAHQSQVRGATSWSRWCFATGASGVSPPAWAPCEVRAHNLRAHDRLPTMMGPHVDAPLRLGPTWLEPRGLGGAARPALGRVGGPLARWSHGVGGPCAPPRTTRSSFPRRAGKHGAFDGPLHDLPPLGKDWVGRGHLAGDMGTPMCLWLPPRTERPGWRHSDPSSPGVVLPEGLCGGWDEHRVCKMF